MPDAPVRAYCPSRFRRAVQLAVTQIGPRQYRVRGQDEPHYDVDLDGDPPCYCRDNEYRGRRIQQKCKHHIAALLQARDPMMLNALIDDYARRLEREENDG